MINKIYSKTKEFIKENLFFILFSIIMLIILNFPIPYYIEAPGGLLDLKNKVEVLDGYKSKGSLNLTYVSTYESNVVAYFLSLINKDWDIVPRGEMIMNNETAEDMDKRNKLLLDNSLSNAYYVAYKELGKDLEIITSNIYVAYIDENADTNLQIGDIFVSIDDKEINDIEDVKEILKTKNIGDKLKVIVNENEEKYITVKELDNKKSLLIYAVCNYNYDSDIKFNFKKGESGPSGGLMIALSIYDQYTEFDLTKGKKIAGTGTIDIDGKVGEISGIKYKIIGAAKERIDLFFVPEANYKEAKEVIEERNLNINLVKVEKFSDAIDYLIK